MNTNCNSELTPNDGYTARIKQVVERKDILEKQQVLLLERLKGLRESLRDVLNTSPEVVDEKSKHFQPNSCPLAVYLQDRIDMNSTAIEEINYILDNLEI